MKQTFLLLPLCGLLSACGLFRPGPQSPEEFYALGQKYEAKGHIDDYSKAVEYYEKAGMLGNAGAQAHLGQLYAAGNLVPQSSTAAFYWYRKAVEQHHARAQYDLAMLFHNGNGGAEAYPSVYQWLTLAHRNGCPEALPMLKKLIPKMTLQQIKEGERLTDFFLQNHPIN